MSIPVSCRQCGWGGAVKDELAGRKAKCPSCGEAIPVARAPEAEEDEAAAYGLAEPPRPAGRAVPKPEARKKRRPATRIESRSRGDPYAPRGLNLNGAAISGLLMMGGAALWFAYGYFLRDRILIYPPFLFVFGVIAFLHGLATRNQPP
jgi:hypothetical protein